MQQKVSAAWKNTQIRRNEAYLLVRWLGRAPWPTRVSTRAGSQAMSEDAVQRSRWSLAELSQAFPEVVKIT